MASKDKDAEHTESGTVTPADEMRAVVDGMAAAALIGQTMGLQILAAEMEVLSHLVPGMASEHAEDRTDAEIDAEIEAGFDNMPI